MYKCWVITRKDAEANLNFFVLIFFMQFKYIILYLYLLKQVAEVWED